jgi:hypothetical protein
MANETSSLQPHKIVLSEEEIFDVGLATFYVFDKENAGAARSARHVKGGPCVRDVRGGPCIGDVRGGPCVRSQRGGPCVSPGSSWS